MSFNDHDLKTTQADSSDQKISWTAADSGRYYENVKRKALSPLRGGENASPAQPAHRDNVPTEVKKEDDDSFETSFGLKISQFPNIEIMVDGNGPVTIGPEMSDDETLNSAETLVIHLSEEEFARHQIELRNLVIWLNKSRKREMTATTDHRPAERINLVEPVKGR